MQRSRSIRPKSPRILDREIASALARPRASHATKTLPYEGSRVSIDPSPRTIKSFELERPYVVRHGGRLYTVVLDTRRGHVAHPATVEGKKPATTKKRSTHATKTKARDKGSDKITIDQLAEMFGLPDWDRIDELNQTHYWEMARGADSEDEQLEAERRAQDEVYAQWYDAVEKTAEKLFDEHGLELEAQPVKRKGVTDKRPHVFKIVPFKSWEDAADKIRETVNGVGDFHFNNLREFVASGPYTARQAVLSHLGYIKKHPHVYGGLGARQLYDQAFG